jgi:hypothetical protein
MKYSMCMRKLIVVLLLALHLCFYAGEAARIRCERETEDSVITSHGTASCFSYNGKNYVITAYHVVENGTIFIEKPEGWLLRKIVTFDKERDIAILNCTCGSHKTELADHKDGVCEIYGSPKGKKVSKITGKIVGGIINCENGFDEGCSGGPIYQNDKLIGIAKSYLFGNKNVVFFIDCYDIKKLLDKIKKD